MSSSSSPELFYINEYSSEEADITDSADESECDLDLDFDDINTNGSSPSSEGLQSRGQSPRTDGVQSIDFKSDAERLQSLTPNPSVEVSVRQTGNIKLTVVKDDIVNQKVDVIVNATAPNLNLQQGVASRALVTKGGNSIQESVNDKYPNGIVEGNIAISEAGTLSCKEVYHITMMKRLPDHDVEMVVSNYVIKILEEADKSGYCSIAFPALGTGSLGYDRTRVARAMFESLEWYAKKNLGSSVNSVLFVIFPSDTDTLDVFKAHGEGHSIDTSTKTVCRKILGPLTVELVVGHLAEQKTDVIVATEARNLDLSRGSQTKYLMGVIGPALQTVCTTDYPRGIQFGDIATILLENESCKAIYFSAIPSHGKPTGCEQSHEEILYNLVTLCMQQASSDGMTSLTFPTLGTGHLMYPPRKSAHFLLSAIAEFVQDNPVCSVTTIKIVVHGLSTTVTSLNILRPFELELSTLSIKKKPVPSDTSSDLSPIHPARNTPEFCMYMYQDPITPPTYWTGFTQSQSVKAWKVKAKGQGTCLLMDVDPQTFNAVENLVQRTWEPAKVGHGRDAKGLSEQYYRRLNVLRIQRVENLNLLEQYGNKRQELFLEAGEGGQFIPMSKCIKQGTTNVERYMDTTWKARVYSEINEGYFFHGTKAKNIKSVCTQGLDPRLAQGEAAYGQAIYMAESSTKADQYTDDRDRRQSHDLHMFLVRASLGKVCVMKECRKLRRAPCQVDRCASDTCGHEIRYNSLVTEDQFIFREFIVHEGSQVYPEYIITYARL